MKISYYLFILITFFGCTTQNPEKYYIKLFKPNSMDISGGPEVGIHTGFLKDDLKVKTPYGNIIAVAAGRLSGYFFDFGFYMKNGNIYMLWPKRRVKIQIDEMEIIIPAYNEGEVAQGIVFYENFTLSKCQAANQVIVAGIQIPAWSYLHFSNDGKLKSFTAGDRWTYMDVEYPPFHQYDVIDNKIIPRSRTDDT
jgi:hypothetical protein